MDGVWTRVGTIVLGAWLVASVFFLPDASGQWTSTWMSGGLAVAFGLLSLAVPRVRLFNTAVAIWLFVSAFALEASGERVWNNAVVAVLLFGLSLVREGEVHAGPFAHHRRLRA